MAVAQLEDLATRFRESKISVQEATQLQEWLDQGGLTGLSDQLSLELEKRGAPVKPSPTEVKRALVTLSTERAYNIKLIHEVLFKKGTGSERFEYKYRDSRGIPKIIEVETLSRLLAGLGYIPKRVRELTDDEIQEVLQSAPEIKDHRQIFLGGILTSLGSDGVEGMIKEEIIRRIQLSEELIANAISYYRHIDADAKITDMRVANFLAGAGYSWEMVQHLTSSEWGYLRSRYLILTAGADRAYGFDIGLMV